MALTYRKLADLKLLENNPRTISEAEFERLCLSLERNPEFFKARPMILSDRTGELVIIAGNMRYRAAEKLGLKKVPTYLISGLTKEQEAEITIRDNIQNGEWDWDVLANDWSDFQLVDWGVPVPTIDDFTPNLEPETGARIVTAGDVIRTKEELESQYKEGDTYTKVICPGCAEEFFLRQE